MDTARLLLVQYYLTALLAIIYASQSLALANSMNTDEEASTCKKLKMTDSTNNNNNNDVPPYPAVAAVPVHVAPKAPYRRNKIVLLGDSITQLSFSASLSGWGSYIADIYQRRSDVFNRGMSGYNTDWYLQYLQTEEGQYDVFGSMNMINNGVQANEHGDGVSESESDVKLVTIFFGANDASCPKLNPRHRVPVSRFKTNLKSLVQLCKENFGNQVRIIFITPPPVHHESRLKYQVDRYGDKATGDLERNMDLASQYAVAVEDVAKELQYPCLNIFQSMQDAIPGEGDEEEQLWSKFLSDGLHLSREGNMFVGQQLKTLVDEVFPEISVEACSHTDYTGSSGSKGGSALFVGSEKGVGPWHDEIDHLDPRKAFDSHEASKRMKI